MQNKAFSHDFSKNMCVDTCKREKAINPEKELQKFLESESE